MKISKKLTEAIKKYKSIKSPILKEQYAQKVFGKSRRAVNEILDKVTPYIAESTEKTDSHEKSIIMPLPVRYNENDVTVLYSSDDFDDDDTLDEAEGQQTSVTDPKFFGGVITLGLDVNAESQRRYANILMNKANQYLRTLINYAKWDDKFNDSVKSSKGVHGWEIVQIKHGGWLERYKDEKGKLHEIVHKEPSLAITIRGISTENLENFAVKLCKEFSQDCVKVELSETKDMFYMTQDGKKWPIKQGPTISIPTTSSVRRKRHS